MPPETADTSMRSPGSTINFLSNPLSKPYLLPWLRKNQHLQKRMMPKKKKRPSQPRKRAKKDLKGRKASNLHHHPQLLPVLHPISLRPPRLPESYLLHPLRLLKIRLQLKLRRAMPTHHPPVEIANSPRRKPTGTLKSPGSKPKMPASNRNSKTRSPKLKNESTN